eukprot:Selendium_serpulae@DN4337_c0_g1_i2.p1
MAPTKKHNVRGGLNGRYLTVTVPMYHTLRRTHMHHMTIVVGTVAEDIPQLITVTRSVSDMKHTGTHTMSAMMVMVATAAMVHQSQLIMNRMRVLTVITAAGTVHLRGDMEVQVRVVGHKTKDTLPHNITTTGEVILRTVSPHHKIHISQVMLHLRQIAMENRHISSRTNQAIPTGALTRVLRFTLPLRYHTTTAVFLNRVDTDPAVLTIQQYLLAAIRKILTEMTGYTRNIIGLARQVTFTMFLLVAVNKTHTIMKDRHVVLGLLQTNNLCVSA